MFYLPNSAPVVRTCGKKNFVPFTEACHAEWVWTLFSRAQIELKRGQGSFDLVSSLNKPAKRILWLS